MLAPFPWAVIDRGIGNTYSVRVEPPQPALSLNDWFPDHPGAVGYAVGLAVGLGGLVRDDTGGLSQPELAMLVAAETIKQAVGEILG